MIQVVTQTQIDGYQDMKDLHSVRRKTVATKILERVLKEQLQELVTSSKYTCLVNILNPEHKHKSEASPQHQLLTFKNTLGKHFNYIA